jgi:hypothetical protein
MVEKALALFTRVSGALHKSNYRQNVERAEKRKTGVETGRNPGHLFFLLPGFYA